MLSMTYDELQDYRTNWEQQGNRLMSREDVARFDAFFNNLEEAQKYNDEGVIRALGGDFSQYETVEPMMKGYLGARKCYELFDRFKGDHTNPKLLEEIKKGLMQVDLRAGFAFGCKDPKNPVYAFMKECERIANREMMLQTLREPDDTAKLRLLNQLKRENPQKAQEKLNEQLHADLEQRVEMAKILFMSHLGKFHLKDRQNKPMEMNENMAEVYAHGGRAMFILPAGGNQKTMMDSIKGAQRKVSGLQRRYFATHALEPRTLNSDGTISSEATELRVKGVSSFAPRRHRGMNVSVGGLGQVGPNGKVITSDGTNGHMYMHAVTGGKNTCGTMLVGFENAGPQKSGRLGHAHGISAKKAGSSAFLSDKSYLGNEFGGRVVDLSGLSGADLTAMMTAFENAYRNAALQAQSGNPALLDACNELLTGKLMSIGQLKGMLKGLEVSDDQIRLVETARAGHPGVNGYNEIKSEQNETIPMKLAEKPEKQPVRVTEFEGFVRPQPPKVMKKPGRWDKFVHMISFNKENTYVSRYKRYKENLPEQMRQYQISKVAYESTLAFLEKGGNPQNLRQAYLNAVAQAKQMFGSPENQAQLQPEDAPVAVSQVVNNRLMNLLIGQMLPEDVAVDNLMEQMEQLREHIRQTAAYRKLMNWNDDKLAEIFNDPDKAQLIVSDIASEISAKNGQNVAQQNPDEVSRNLGVQQKQSVREMNRK